MSTLRSIGRPHAAAIASILSSARARRNVSSASTRRNPNPSSAATLRSPPGGPFSFDDLTWTSRASHRRTCTCVANWNSDKSPYETLELQRDADEEKIKSAYRRLAKYYHPDVYDGRGTLEEGETAEARFIKIQAAYELLIDEERHWEYDREHRVNPMKASQSWMEWLIKKRKAFDQRGDMAIAAWAEQQQRELNIRARRLSHSKIDPDEERRILAREKKAYKDNFSITLKRHTLVLKKRDLMRRKAEEEKMKTITQLLAAEGLELDTEEEETV